MTADEMKGRVFMICGDDETAKDVGDCLKRVSSAMSAVLSFSDKMADLDEDAPDLNSQVAPLLERMTLTLMSIYPVQQQMEMDIKSIGDFTVRKIDL